METPAVTPVTIPVDEPIEAIEAKEEDQVPPEEVSVIVMDDPLHSEEGPAMLAGLALIIK